MTPTPDSTERQQGGEAHFHTAETTRQREGESDIRWANRTFAPSFPGVHLCGADHEEDRFFTIADYPLPSDEAATALFTALKAECEVEQEAGDFLVDLNMVNGHEDDFWCSRQMLPRLARIVAGEGARA